MEKSKSTEAIYKNPFVALWPGDDVMRAIERHRHITGYQGAVTVMRVGPWPDFVAAA